MASPLVSTLSLPLIFGSFDPSGASNLPIDAVICARMGMHAGSVATAIHVQDTTGVESIQRLSPELIDDQARCLLEDMAIGSLKIGPQYDPETIAVLAQIAADYNTLPLVLQLGTPPSVPDLDDLDPEDTLSALLDLLAPQARLVIVDATLPEQWAGQGLLSAAGADDPVQALLELGADHVLCSNASLSSGLNGLTLHSRDQASRRWPWSTAPVRASDGDSLLATVLTCLLARGLDPAEAAQQAVATATNLMAHPFHPGMGQHLLQHTLS
ncbi:bifunctional hydroxymethylpyrimidine kinase/phosphomethylpyrimidine kinase [uncultured Castellaniella sp.]|uniref:bifunctional hydroxymethylpyrimidine kinase/phosphomethylpyrimidine kinase n=1 Tax=uncultured Castellaniella sp. TaxID=647907 RepID=UPI00260C360B|nr:bifunctional hydroxymethylpyrimidine kinase/phosphomethylpyrimidine kinase [uncultured Castellaniella sp.]